MAADTAKKKTGKRLYTAVLLVICVALGAVVAGKITTRVRENRRKAEANRILLEQYEKEAAELEAQIREIKEETVRIDSRYRTVLGQLRETDRDFYNLYNMYSRSLENDRVLAGLTTVTGSGIIIKLDDSGLVQRSLVHDTYLAEILNVLKSAGAQAISINGERIVPTSEVLCLGPSIRVNGTRLFAPYRISAVGDPDTLMRAYQESRVYNTIVSQNLLYDVQRADNIVISAFTGDLDKYTAKLF